jgi:parallel beta-helix repeat protein
VKKFISWVLIIMLLAAPGCAGKKSIPAAPKQGAITLAYEFPRDTKHIEVYIGLATGFTPTGWDGSAWTGDPNTLPNWDGSTNTLYAVIAPAKKFNISGLTPGVTYYARLVVVDFSGQRSDPSTEMSAVAGDTQRSSTLVVAASDASPAAKAGADYVCTGTDDQDTINTAINALPVVTKETGTAQAGAASTITLASDASALDDEYNSLAIEITAGTGAGQIKTISDYVGSTKVATVSAAWDTQPDNTSVYNIKGKTGQIQLTEGIFLFSNSLTLINSLEIAGSGQATKIRQADNINLSLFINNGNCNISISGMLLDINRPNNTGSGETFWNTAIYLAGGRNIKIDKCVFIYSKFGVFSENCSYLSIINSEFHDNGMGVWLTGGQFIKFEGNNVHYNNYGIYFHGPNNSNIINNIISQNNRHGIQIYGATTAYNNNNNISNNQFSENGLETNNTYSHILIYGDGANNVIQGNVIRAGSQANKAKYGIRLDSSTKAINRTLVTGNDCYQSGVTAGISNAGTNTSFGAGNRNNDGTWSTTPN